MFFFSLLVRLKFFTSRRFSRARSEREHSLLPLPDSFNFGKATPALDHGQSLLPFCEMGFFLERATLFFPVTVGEEAEQLILSAHFLFASPPGPNLCFSTHPQTPVRDERETQDLPYFPLRVRNFYSLRADRNASPPQPSLYPPFSPKNGSLADRPNKNPF